MDNIKLIRVDYRLIHGQVITKWFGQIQGQEIVIIDDTLSNDSFMADIYKMSAPPSSKVSVYSVEESVLKLKNNSFSKGRTLVLFKTVDQVKKAFKSGFPFDEIQIGGLGSAPGRKTVFGPITLDDSDAQALHDINKSGVRVYFHQVPEERKMELEDILNKNSFNIS